jgi:hypothetical protein
MNDATRADIKSQLCDFRGIDMRPWAYRVSLGDG